MHTKDFQIWKRGAPPQTESDDTRLPTGQCTPEAPTHGLRQTIGRRALAALAAFGDEPADLSVAATAACRLSAVAAIPAAKGPRFRGPSWADMSEELEFEHAGPQIASRGEAGCRSGARPSCRSTPDVRSWASTPDPSPRALGPSAAPADRQRQGKTVLSLESALAGSDPGSSGARSDPESSDVAVLALIRGLREATMLD